MKVNKRNLIKTLKEAGHKANVTKHTGFCVYIEEYADSTKEGRVWHHIEGMNVIERVLSHLPETNRALDAYEKTLSEKYHTCRVMGAFGDPEIAVREKE